MGSNLGKGIQLLSIAHLVVGITTSGIECASGDGMHSRT